MAKKIPGVPSAYPTGDMSVGPSGPPLAGARNADRASRVSPREPRRTSFHRSAMAQNEALGARLTVSPSMKTPVNSPESQATQANGRIVPSRSGRSTDDFLEEQTATQVGQPQWNV